MPMLPRASMAGLAIQRKKPSGAYVPCWNRLTRRCGSTRNSYQRTPPPPAAVFTEWTATIDSRSSIRR